MRHLLLALPLLGLTAACGQPCAAPSLTVSWRFDLPDGTRGATCATAGVATVDLWIDGNPTPAGAGMACEQGAATFAGLAAGNHVLTIQGRSASGALLYQAWGQAAMDGCGETRTTMAPGAGYLRIGYATSTGLCWAAGDPLQSNGFIWYQVNDVTTGQPVSISNGYNAPAAVPCQADPGQAEVNLRLPYGNYALRWIEVVRDPIVNPRAVYQYCSSTPVTVQTPGVTSIDAALVPATDWCPP
jgi:hypothetical protein